MKFQVLVADDHAIIRDGLRKILADTDDFEVVAQASNGNAVLEEVVMVGYLFTRWRRAGSWAGASSRRRLRTRAARAPRPPARRRVVEAAVLQALMLGRATIADRSFHLERFAFDAPAPALPWPWLVIAGFVAWFLYLRRK